MRLVRFATHAGVVGKWGSWEDDGVICELMGHPLSSMQRGSPVGPATEVRLLPPCQPSKVVCAAINYWGATDMLEGQTEPVVFLKSPTSVCGPHEAIVCTFDSAVVCWGEAELAAVIGRRSSRIHESEVDSHVLGWTQANDATAENVESRDHHLMRSKAPDTFCPIGPYIDTSYEPCPRRVQGFHNGKLVRDGNTADLFWDHRKLISWLSSWITLEPWDIVLTGSPPLVGPLTFLEPGDVFVVRIDGFPDLVNPFRRDRL